MPTREGDLTTVEASELLDRFLSPDSVARAIRSGKMEGYQLAGRWLTSPEAVESYKRDHLNKKGWAARRLQDEDKAPHPSPLAQLHSPEERS